MCGSAGIARSVSSAGAILRSIRSATPAASQASFPYAVHSSEMSHAISTPSAGSACAMERVEKPVKVPISTMWRAPVSRTRKASSGPCSSADCIPATSGNLA